MPKGKRGSHGAADPLEWHLIFEATDNRFRTKAEFEAAIPAARALFQRTGKESPGIHVTVRWRNPDSESEYSSMWKTSDDSDQDLKGAYDTIVKKVRAGGGQL